jgi:hypothetical protein
MKTDMISGRTAGQPGSADLKSLQVIDLLEVGPVRVEKKRLCAPYRIFQDGGSDRFELIYTFEEAVFEPEEPESRNLAAMIAAQVALNYGLFCREMLFHGPYDALDRRFLRNMAENTAREIYVKKFLEPNPFLVGDAAHLAAVKQTAYLQARLKFSDSRHFSKAVWQAWSTNRSHCAVLSSGGKDSLLSFGLMREISGGRTDTVHPLFVNESGRHWFTALNAYRHFSKNVPNTGRVWVNSDRLFAWMLRHLPFIRKDFADLRTDEYPIRLWTVAVFLFGVLPLMRKRGIGRLLVGDEFDTTVRARTRGIPHYDGLYDQSIYVSLFSSEGLDDQPVLHPATFVGNAHRNHPGPTLSRTIAPSDVLPRRQQEGRPRPAVRSLRKMPPYRRHVNGHRRGSPDLRLQYGADPGLPRPYRTPRCSSGGAGRRPPPLSAGAGRPCAAEAGRQRPAAFRGDASAY